MKKLSKFVLCAACASLAGIVISACPKLSVDGPYVCQNGTPVAGLAPQQPTTKCAACDAGYRLDGEACAANVYACANGTAAAGIPETDGAPRCESCNSGYHLRDRECVPNRYFCANGEPRTGLPLPPTNNTPGCAACTSGYYLAERADGAICETNAYACPNGTPAGGQAPANGDILCAQCDLGYRLDNDACVEHLYTCRNGTARDGRLDKDHNQEFCVSCADTNTHSLFIDAVTASQTCAAKNGYNCFNGTPAAGTQSPGTERCATCDRGYHRDGARCEANTYTCSNGTAARGTPSTTGVRRCAACDSGYFLDGLQCKSLRGFGVGEYDPIAMTAIGNTLYMVGNNTDRLYTIDYTTGVATPVRLGTGFGVEKWRPSRLTFCFGPRRDSIGDYCVGEYNPNGLTSVDGQLYMMGASRKFLYRLDFATGVATPVVESYDHTFWGGDMFSLNSVLYTVQNNDTWVVFSVNTTTTVHRQAGRRTPRFGVGEERVAGLTTMDGVVYMLGGSTGRLYTLDVASGVATRVGTATRVTAGSWYPRSIAAVDGNLYAGESSSGRLYLFDLTTGTAKPVPAQ